jgi:hypothetical protein
LWLALALSLLLVGGVAIGYYAWRTTTDNASLQRQQTALLKRLSSAADEKSATERSLRDTRQELSKVQAELSSMPDFLTVGLSWDGPCSADSCHVKGTFRNVGGAGSGVARFGVFVTKEDVGKDLGRALAICTAAIPQTPRNGTVDVRCTATSSRLADHFRSGGGVYFFGWADSSSQST